MHCQPLDYGGPTDRPYEPIPRAALDGSIGDRFEEMVRRFGDRVAISDGGTEVTYAELGARCRRIAAAVARIEPSGPVAVLCRHGHRFVAAVLGTMAAGRACIPLDADHPLDRNARIARHAGAAAVVSTGDIAVRARALFGAELPVLDLDAVSDVPEDAPGGPRPGPEDIAYILYTSGSTGQPKGVFQDHRGLLRDAQELVEVFHANPEDRLTMLYSPATIAGFDQLLAALLSGASLEVLSPGGLGARELARAIKRSGSTVLNASPTLFRHIVHALGEDERLDCVRLVALGGERVDWGDFDVFRRGCPEHAVMSVHLGATECCIHSRWFVDEAVRGSSNRMPAGWTVPERKVTLVDPSGEPVADGETGEIVVSSRYVARGYWREPELTAQAFGTDPQDPSARTYRTGDLARRRPDGLLEHEGRKDQQIKLHGYRTEPGEVEGALRTCPGVRDAAVVVRRNASGAPFALAAYVELAPEGRGLQSRHLAAMLRQRIPAHMAPASVNILPSLPWLANFKIDRQRLSALDAERVSQAAKAADPLTAEVVRTFEEVLGIQGAGPEDNLSSLGGDSLQAITVALRLEERFGLKLAKGAFDATRPIAEWARMFGARAETPRRRSLMSQVSPTVAAEAAGLLAKARAAGAPPALRSRPQVVWAAAVQLMLTQGELELAHWAVARLSKVFPDTPFFPNLDLLLGRTPPAEGLSPLAPDRGEAVLAARRPGAEATLLHFAGAGDVGLGMPLPLVHRWLGLLDANVVYLRPFNEDYYLAGLPHFGSGIAAMVEGLKTLLRELGGRRIYCSGGSMGGFAAIRFGLELKADAILATGAQTIVGPDFDREGVRLNRRRLARDFPGAALDVAPLWEASAGHPRLMLIYGDCNWDDRLHAERMAGLPNVELRPVDGFDGHFIASELIRRGEYLPLLRGFVSGKPPWRRDDDDPSRPAPERADAVTMA